LQERLKIGEKHSSQMYLLEAFQVCDRFKRWLPGVCIALRKSLGECRENVLYGLLMRTAFYTLLNTSFYLSFDALLNTSLYHFFKVFLVKG